MKTCTVLMALCPLAIQISNGGPKLATREDQFMTFLAIQL